MKLNRINEDDNSYMKTLSISLSRRNLATVSFKWSVYDLQLFSPSELMPSSELLFSIAITFFIAQ